MTTKRKIEIASAGRHRRQAGRLLLGPWAGWALLRAADLGQSLSQGER